MKKIVAYALLCGVAPFAWCRSQAPAPTTIKLEPYLGAALSMHADINGHEGIFLFDTGGGLTVISPEFAQTIGCKPWGRITGFRMTGERLDLPRCDNLHVTIEAAHLEVPIASVIDLKTLLPKDAPHLDGSFGLDMLAGKTITFDESGRTLTLETPESLKARLRNAKEVPIRLVRDAGGVALSVQVAVPTSQGMAWMEIDSGNNGPLVIAKHLAPLLHLDPEKTDLQSANFSLAGDIPVEGQARTQDLIMDGNLGVTFLKNWVLTLDLASGKAWLSHPAPSN